MTLPLTAAEACAPASAPRLPDAPPAPWLRGERLRLREFCAEDLADLMRMHADRRLRAHLLDDQPLDKTLTAVQFLVHVSRVYRRHEGLGIWHASAGGGDDAAPRFIGWFNLMPLPARGDGAIELGSRLVPGAWGGALAMEGGELLLDHAFDRLRLPRVWATCDPDNRSARACLAALGFQEQGLDDYDGRPGVYAFVERAHWSGWRRLPRRERLRAARAARQDADEAHATHATHAAHAAHAAHAHRAPDGPNGCATRVEASP